MKKTEFITFRTDKDTKAVLEEVAAQRKWSISLLAEEIVKEWIEKRTADQIPKE